MATGDVIVVLDAHMEVQDKWLEALIFEIKKDRKLLATITMDWMAPSENGSWQYRYGPGNFVCYFDWNLVFGYSWPSVAWETVYRNDSTVPLPSPCTVGNWAMDKSFFIEIGELDEGMEMWGGENIDLAIRTWLFGGRTVQVPCSHAAHQERPQQRAYRESWLVHQYKNYKRLVEVWFDGYKKYFYQAYPELVNLDAGDLTARMELKKRAKHGFSWFLKHVYPQLGLYDVNTLAYGQLKMLDKWLCMNYGTMNDVVQMASCPDSRTPVFISQSGVLRTSAAVLVPRKWIINAKLYFSEALHLVEDESLPVWIHWKDGPIKVVGHDFCLDLDNSSNAVVLRRCDPCRVNQRWRFQNYTPLYEMMLASATADSGAANDGRWNKKIMEELNGLRRSWTQPMTNNTSTTLIVC